MEKFYIDPADGEIVKYYLNPSEYPVFYIDPTKDNPQPGAEEGAGGEEATYAWILYQTPQWTGGYCLSGWNESAGDYTGGYLYYTITNPIYTHAKVVGVSGSSGYWYSSDSKYMASIGVKTLADYDTCGEGGSTIATRQTYANSAAAIAAWPGSSTKVMRIGGDKKIVLGFEGSPGTYTMLFSIYLGYEV